MNIQSLSALLAAIVSFAIGSSVVLRDRRQRAYRLFAVFCFVLCLWHITTFLQATLEWDSVYFVSLVASVAIPIASMRFFRVFLADERAARAATPRWMVPLAVGFIVAIGYAIAFRKYRLHHSWTFTLALGGYVFGGLYASMLELYGKYRSTLARVEKTRIKFLLIGGLASITFAATDFLPKLGLPFPAVGNVLTIIYLYFISQTLFRYRLLDLTELLGRMVVIATFVLILAAIYGLLVAWIPADQSGVFFFNTLVASFVILILFDPLRTAVEGQVQKWMFREKYELKARIDALRHVLTNVIDLKEAVRITISSLEESRRVTHASLYLVDADGGGFELHGHLGPRPVERIDAAARRPFFERINATRLGAVSIEQLEREHSAKGAAPEPETETIDAIARTLDEMNAALCIPVVADEQIIGLLGLKDERVREAYATDEIDLFRGVAAQIAITVQNSKLYERMKERDRLAALGEMAAGLAHEIRNPLGAIKGAAQLLIPQGDAAHPLLGDGHGVPAEAREFLGIIVEEANRLNRVVSQFLDYARPYRGEPQPLDVNEVVRKTAQLVTPPPLPSVDGTEAAPPVEVHLQLADELPRARADAEQLRQVFLNLAINGVQAMPSGGKLTISTALRKAGRRSTPMLEVRFRDTGVGIPGQELKNLFIPFYTTKDKGTGLGLPISQRIIENHGGTIEVRSRVGVGSTFTVVLPLFDDVKEAKPELEARASSG
ncbi:MAG: signal transduction histidine kinase, nitrogen specific, NtrB [Myxococcales bacterium]|nr:signal transduction histidine kinase, nitrogen specific, NtrB [Myxococcales bacterium]